MSNESIDKLIEQFTSEDDLRKYASSQFKVIQNLTKQIAELRKENEELKSKPVQVQTVQSVITPMSSFESSLSTSDEETICIYQLRILRDLAVSRELTLEEAKKVDLFNKNLREIRNIPKKVEVSAKDMTTEQLLKAIDETTQKPN